MQKQKPAFLSLDEMLALAEKAENWYSDGNGCYIGNIGEGNIQVQLRGIPAIGPFARASIKVVGARAYCGIVLGLEEDGAFWGTIQYRYDLIEKQYLDKRKEERSEVLDEAKRLLG